MAGHSSEAELRAAIVAEALSWANPCTPYHHQQSVKGLGADCLGLVRGVYRGVIGPEPAVAPNYSRDWAEASGAETLLEAFRRFLREIPIDDAKPGDALVFRMRRRAMAKHCGVIVAPDRMVHAYEGAGAIEQSISEFTTRNRHVRVAGAFAFPGA